MAKDPASKGVARFQLADVGYDEWPMMPNFRIKIIGHASPRWKSANSATEANKKNYALSMARARSARMALEESFKAKLGSLVTVDFKEEIATEDGTISAVEVPRGRIDSLINSGGDLNDNSNIYKRVDVHIKMIQRIRGQKRLSKPIEYRAAPSRHWRLSVDVNAGAYFGVGGGMISMTIINDLTGHSMFAHGWLGGAGPKASLGASVSIWSDPTPFTTDRPVNFQDFNNVFIEYSVVGASAFIGYELSTLSFIGLGEGARGIDVGGASLGSVGVGWSTNVGIVRVDTSGNDTVAVKGSDVTTTQFQRSESGIISHQIYFKTEDSGISNLEMDMINDLTMSAIKMAKRESTAVAWLLNKK